MLCHRAFVDVVQERCASVDGSKFVGVANPEGPQHWYKINLVDQTDGEESLNFPFELADNETLTQRQIERLYRIYPPGPMRDRRIFGKWIATQGLVYPFYEDAVVKPPKDEQPYRHSISIDHADSSCDARHSVRLVQVWNLGGGGMAA